MRALSSHQSGVVIQFSAGTQDLLICGTPFFSGLFGQDC